MNKDQIMSRIICRLTLVPLRSEPDHRTEQVSQMLFGETAVIKEVKQNWYRIVMDNDSYTGWVEADSMQSLQSGSYNQERIMVRKPFIQLKHKNEGLIICAGSEILLPDTNNTVTINERIYKLTNTDFSVKNSIIDDALKYVNTPYLWGGRTVFGCDCSGYIQTVFRINNIRLPRDAKDQAKKGIELPSFDEIRAGDLVFFENESRNIMHVGLYLGESKIIHASKWVRIDRLDEKGIYNEETKKYTHKFNSARRME